MRSGLKKVFTQESVVRVGLEEFFRSVQVEAEWQEDFDVGFLLKQGRVGGARVLQLIDANRILTSCITLRVQRIHYLSWFRV